MKEVQIRAKNARGVWPFVQSLFRTGIYTFLSLTLSCFHLHATLDLSNALKVLKSDTPVRVLLKQDSLTSVQWSLGSDGGCIIYAPETQKAVVYPESDLRVTYKDGAFLCNASKHEESVLFILPLKGMIRTDSVSYDGFFCVSRVEGNCYLVNHVDLEQYLESVLPYESIPTWPDEVQKALCIACRTYAVSKVAQHRESGYDHKWPYPYDLKCTVIDQVYRGHEKRARLKKFVDETKGIVLGYQGKVIRAMYHSVCGGVIPALTTRFDLAKTPYLKRDYACTHCTEHQNYRWICSYDFKELEPVLKTQIPALDTVRDLKIGDYDLAGVAHKVYVKDASGTWHSLPAPKFRELFGRIRSISCEFSTDGATLTISGKGHGHHVGLCQWGAYSMVTKGSTYKEVLSFYYPGTTLMKLPQ